MKTLLTSNGEMLGEVDIRWGIFQHDSLSPLLFIIIMLPLIILHREETLVYAFGSDGNLINQMLFMDDLKLYGKSDRELESLVKVVGVFSKDIGMEFGMEKCQLLTIKFGKKECCEGIVTKWRGYEGGGCEWVFRTRR